MAEGRFPQQNLNPAAAPWGRAVEGRTTDAERRLAQLETALRGLNEAALKALRRGGADGTVYRRDGILVPGSQDEFTIYKGAGPSPAVDDDGSSFGMIDFLNARVAIRSVGVGTYQMRQDFESQFAALTYNTGLRENDRQILQTGWSYEIDGRGLPAMNLVQIGTEQPLVQIGYDEQSQPFVKILGQEVGSGSGQVADATHTSKGIVRLATAGEATTGTDDTTAVTPKQLRAATASAGKPPVDYFRGDWVQP